MQKLQPSANMKSEKRENVEFYPFEIYINVTEREKKRQREVEKAKGERPSWSHN